jgi:hypothetical protein
MTHYLLYFFAGVTLGVLAGLTWFARKQIKSEPLVKDPDHTEIFNKKFCGGVICSCEHADSFGSHLSEPMLAAPAATPLDRAKALQLYHDLDLLEQDFKACDLSLKEVREIKRRLWVKIQKE